ncbi:ferric-dicitrate binding protein FerR, regulates iron transport through sigma-19 [Chitinophaga eiseniae]|uniref:Ferric-dicitrate binding protein FerR, regulates iron transport through sigma-19 n=1 Tax=Chitinophaga eiseniae TaxID=634771 RepID=A0A1T4TCL3_9BACT|nr:FecR domain-containing protein [Chitinophaga eiseniae]SKA38147.1 ferric-dicitrate binding protein FerR, regulates iron transport through sigma-19 [Chitinophaga eiseniae]
MDEISVEKLIGEPSFINYCFRNGEVDTAYWEAWQQAHPEHQSVIREAAAAVKMASWLLQAEKAKPAAMEALDEWLLQATQPRVRRRSWYYAAAAALLLLLAIAWFFRPSPSSPPAVAVRQDAPRLHFSTVGQPRTGFRLPDNSYVLLESNSVLDLDSAFGQQHRHLRLRGTAWFKVQPDRRRSFEVQGQDYFVTALGTAFRMTAAKGKIQVLLEEGKVKVEKQLSGERKLLAILQPSESLLIDPVAPAHTKKSIFPQEELGAWKAEEIVFDHTPLPEVIQQLEACYNIRITIAGNNLQQETFTGKFKHDALPAVLDILCFTLNKQYRFTDSTNVLIQ